MNLLVGMNGSYIDVKNIEYTVQDTSQMIIHGIDGTFAHSAGNSGGAALFGLRGLGLGTTLGLTYVHKRISSGYE